MTTLNKSFWEHHFKGYDLSKRHHIEALNAVFRNASLQDKDLVDVFLLNLTKNENGLSLLLQKINQQASESNQAQQDVLITTMYQVILKPLYKQNHLQLKAMLHYVITSAASDTLKTELLTDIWKNIGMRAPEDTEAKDIFLSYLTQTINNPSEFIPNGFTNKGFTVHNDYWVKTTFIIQLMKRADFKAFLLPSPQTIGLSGFETRVIPFFARLNISDEERQLFLSTLLNEELIPLVCNNILNPLLDMHLGNDSADNDNSLMARYLVERVIIPQVIKDETKLRFFLQRYKNFPQVLGYMANQLPTYRPTILEFLSRSNFDLFFRFSPANESSSSLIALWNEQILPQAKKEPKLLADFMNIFVNKLYINSYSDLLAESHFMDYLSSFLMTEDFSVNERYPFAIFKSSYVAQYELMPIVSTLLIEKCLLQKLQKCSNTDSHLLRYSIGELMEFLEKLHPIIENYPDRKELVLRKIENYLQDRDHLQEGNKNAQIQMAFSSNAKLRWFLLSYAYHIPVESVASLKDFEFLVKLRTLEKNDSDFLKEAAFIELYPNCENTLVGLLNRTAVVKRKAYYISKEPQLSFISSLFTICGGSATRIAYRVQEHKKHLSLDQLQECANGCPDPFNIYGTVKLSILDSSEAKESAKAATGNERETTVVLPASIVMKSEKPVTSVSYPHHVDEQIPLLSFNQSDDCNLPMAVATMLNSTPYPVGFFPPVPNTEIRPRNRNEESANVRELSLAR